MFVKKGGVTFSLLVLGLIIILSSSVNAATSCDVLASRNTLIEADFYDTQGTARSLVLGEAKGSFSDDTSVEIDCNVENVQPAPVQRYVKARLTFTQSTLSYRVDCFYPRPKVDTTYIVGARVLPENVSCVRAIGKSTVTTPGSGEEDKKTTLITCGIVGAKICDGVEKCKAPAVYDGYGSCTACPSGTKNSQGRCINNNEIEDDPALGKLVCLEGETAVDGKCVVTTRLEPSCPEKFTFDSKSKLCIEAGKKVDPTCPEKYTFNKDKGICVKKVKDTKEHPEEPEEPIAPTDADFVIDVRKKTAYIGIPFSNSEVIEHTCTNAKTYWYDGVKKKYVRITKENLEDFAGKGILIQSKSACKLAFDGTYDDEQTLNLIKGWNFVSAQTEAFFEKKNIETDCTFKSIYSHHPETGKKITEKEPLLKPGLGYWIKVKKTCTLSASLDGDVPAAPEDEG